MFFRERATPEVSVSHELTPTAVNHRHLLAVSSEGSRLADLAAIDRELGEGWTLHYAGDVASAVGVMDTHPIDAVLAFAEDTEAGARLLEWVRHRSPATIRLAAVHLDDPVGLDAAASDAHQIFTITPDPREVAQSLTRTVALCARLGSSDLLEIAGSFKQIPTLPRVYTQLRSVMDGRDYAIREVAEVIATDPGLSVRVLKIVNSAYYGLRNHVHDLAQAIGLLGAPMVSSLVLGVTVQDQFPSQGPVARMIEDEWRRALAVAGISRTVATKLGLDRDTVAMSNLGGLLHNVGRLVLLANSWPFDDVEVPSTLGEVIDLEQRRFGLTYPALGGLMLRYWGIDEPVVEAVVFHADPDASGTMSPTPLAAVHAAVAAQPVPELEIDRDYIHRIGAPADLPDWVESKRVEAALEEMAL